jgi:signal transduction histidine kinase
MKANVMEKFSGRYLAALGTYVEQGLPAGLKAARRLGMRAVTLEIETLDLAKIHAAQAALVMHEDASDERDNSAVARSAAFFCEANAAIEKTHPLAITASADIAEISTDLALCTGELAASRRELKQGISRRLAAVETLKNCEARSARLLTEARRLEEHLRELARIIFCSHEEERKTMSLTLQDEIAQTLLGIQVRLVALDCELSVSTDAFKKEIATTQRLVQESVKTINRFAREFGIAYET